MSTFILAGHAGIEPTPSVSKTEMISISPMAVLTGPASKNRTHIQEVEALCIIHYTMAGYVVPLPRLERGLHSF